MMITIHYTFNLDSSETQTFSNASKLEKTNRKIYVFKQYLIMPMVRLESFR